MTGPTMGLSLGVRLRALEDEVLVILEVIKVPTSKWATLDREIKIPLLWNIRLEAWGCLNRAVTTERD